MIAYILVLLLTNGLTYWYIRNMIYTIIWCDQKARSCNVRNLRKHRSKWQFLRMKCFETYTNMHRKNFRFWIKVKDCFLILESLAMVLLLIIHLIAPIDIANSISSILLIHAWIIAVMMIFQSDFHRNTKYDRIRLKNIHKK